MAEPVADDIKSFSAPRGTYDLLPPASGRMQELFRLSGSVFGAAGYEPVETPAFEHTEVFERGVGESSEVVNKQMYTFEDRAGRSLTLRPECTAPVVRAILEHGLDRGPLPVKLFYTSTNFRQERPQRGRYRQFWQIGIEAVGSDDAMVDAEVIELGDRFLRAAGVEPRLYLNSIGHLDVSCRLGYNKVLAEFLEANTDRLAPVDRDRIESNPLRTFDSKEEKTIEVMREAPLISDHLCADCAAHFREVLSLLDTIGLGYEIAPRLVRGLDYYTRTTFEFVAAGLGSQDAVGGGGRYDGLAELLGGPRLPGMGFALGADRILMAGEQATEVARKVTVYIVTLGDAARVEGFRLAARLREAGIGTSTDLAGRSVKGQMKDAARSGARWAAIIGDDELATGQVALKNLVDGDQISVPSGELVERVSR